MVFKKQSWYFFVCVFSRQSLEKRIEVLVPLIKRIDFLIKNSLGSADVWKIVFSILSPLLSSTYYVRW